eukprot:TRINITY_DN8343_c0_g1_i1.p1 TRINITY_DN8343_c0_g1~~TRINITY_DN8343_c0_g1_i1.p1  ORF type:complete len:341 (-),score=67.52 TRINITY_DN8343_c0_g1_i1:21-1043(-)
MGNSCSTEDNVQSGAAELPVAKPAPAAEPHGSEPAAPVVSSAKMFVGPALIDSSLRKITNHDTQPVKSVTKIGSPGCLLVFGPNAYALGADNNHDVWLAAASRNRGSTRVLVFSQCELDQSTFFDDASRRTLLSNAVVWAPDKAHPRVLSLARFFKCDNVIPTEADPATLQDISNEVYDVVLWDGLLHGNIGLMRLLQGFCNSGGSVVMTASGLHWQQIHAVDDPQRALHRYPANVFLAPFGIFCGAQSCQGTDTELSLAKHPVTKQTHMIGRVRDILMGNDASTVKNAEALMSLLPGSPEERKAIDLSLLSHAVDQCQDLPNAAQAFAEWQTRAQGLPK